MKSVAGVAVAWVAVAFAAVGLHPALRDGAPLAGLGRQIREDAAQGGVLLATLGMSGSDVTLAWWALDLSLLYIAGWAFLRLCPRGEGAPSGVPVALLVAALAGQAAASFASNAKVFYFLAAGIAALSLVFCKREVAPVLPHKGRLVAASLVGLLVILLASPLDSLIGASMLPEAWWPIAVEFESKGGWPAGLALSVVVAAACGALGFARAGWVGLAPAVVLVLGPSNP
ncbi:MAG TPA: hypothetical protein VJU16_07205, partial [Planctomycetota bacterium]|nr:hypothetical protein [Planctomycetota bacterium]